VFVAHVVRQFVMSLPREGLGTAWTDDRPVVVLAGDGFGECVVSVVPVIGDLVPVLEFLTALRAGAVDTVSHRGYNVPVRS
jgi:hypothetical protein